MAYGTAELVKLAELSRVGLKTTRDIARVRVKDYKALMDIANRAEIIAYDMDRITCINTANMLN